MIDEIKKDAESRMGKSINSLRGDLSKLRTGRANTALLDHVQVDYYGQKTPLNQVAGISVSDAQTLTLPELGRYIEYLEHNGSNVAGYRLRYWQRLATPLAVLAMLLLAVGLVLGPLARQGIGQRILVGVVAGLVFKLVNETSLHAGLVYGIAPWVSALLPSLLVSLGGLWLLRDRH